MTIVHETMSDDIKSFDWSTLSPGQYKIDEDGLHRIDTETTDCDDAADKFVSALRRMTQ